MIDDRVKKIGNLSDSKTQSRTVYDADGVSPTLCSGMDHGNTMPMVIEDAKCVGGLGEKKSNGGTQYYQQDRVYYGDIAMCHPSQIPGGSYNYVVEEPTICRMVGRNPDNPTDRTVGIPTEQRLEPNAEGICNCLTSVTKDNIVLEGISPTLTNMQGGGRQPMIIDDTQGFEDEPRIYKDLSPCLRSERSGLKTIETAIIRVIGNHMNSGHDASRVVDTEGIAPTVKENHGTVTGIVDTVRIKQATKEGYIECKVGGVADLSFPNSATRRGRVQDMGETCPTILSGENGLHRIESMYRIRKLTPKECWRLMDFKDEDFHKAEQVNSNTQLYKQAGNSIVKNCLVAIFGQMIPGKENVYKERFDERKI